MNAYGSDYENQLVQSFAAQQKPMDAIMDDFRWDWHQLLVLGNGFDLEAGLPSKFSDFIHARRILSAEGSPDPSTTASKLSFKKRVWDLILTKGGEGSWCDIEGAVAKWVVPKDQTSGSSPACPAEKVLQEASEESRFANGGQGLSLVGNYIDRQSGFNLRHWSLEQLYGYLLSEMHGLEADFESYLSESVRETRAYFPNARALLSALLNDEMPAKDDCDRSVSVLSFNYTTPVNKGSLRYGGDIPINYINIHGELGRGIVFGIDGTGLLGNPLVLPFTKTYRIMERGETAPYVIVRKEDGDSRDYGTQLIKFYGHSLGPADYSYFQSIFDTIDLYGSDTRLVFYFKPFERLEVEDARADMMGKAIRLLDAYGKTLDNADHGKNLIHKLILEGRLSVKLLPDYSKDG